MRSLRLLQCLAVLLMLPAAPALAQSAPPAPVCKAPSDGRIVGGCTVPNGEAPWAVEIIDMTVYTKQDLHDDLVNETRENGQSDFASHRQDWDIRLACGGVAISNAWILTAKHCTQDAPENVRFDDLPAYFKAHFRVHIGSSSILPGKGSLCPVIDVRPYPDDDQADVALIRIDPATCTPPGTLAPIRVAGTAGDDPLRENFVSANEFDVYGWGMTKARAANAKLGVTSGRRRDDNLAHLDPNSSDLRRATVHFIDAKACAARPGYRAMMTRTRICAGVDQGGTDQCSGDSGGPLVMNLSPPSGLIEPVLVGVVHGGIGCALRRHPGVYEYAPAYLDWIRSVVGAGNLVQAGPPPP